MGLNWENAKVGKASGVAPARRIKKDPAERVKMKPQAWLCGNAFTGWLKRGGRKKKTWGEKRYN